MPAMAPVDRELLLGGLVELEDVDPAVAAALEEAGVLEDAEPGIGGDMLNAGEK